MLQGWRIAVVYRVINNTWYVKPFKNGNFNLIIKRGKRFYSEKEAIEFAKVKLNGGDKVILMYDYNK